MRQNDPKGWGSGDPTNDYWEAYHAAECARDLAQYIEHIRPDLEESVLSLRGLEIAIRRTIASGVKEKVNGLVF